MSLSESEETGGAASCVSCGAEVGQAKFCPECGEPVPPPKTACPGCGHRPEVLPKFCPECGAEMPAAC